MSLSSRGPDAAHRAAGTVGERTTDHLIALRMRRRADGRFGSFVSILPCPISRPLSTRPDTITETGWLVAFLGPITGRADCCACPASGPTSRAISSPSRKAHHRASYRTKHRCWKGAMSALGQKRTNQRGPKSTDVRFGLKKRTFRPTEE